MDIEYLAAFVAVIEIYEKVFARLCGSGCV